MKFIIHISSILVVLLLSGCAGIQLPAIGNSPQPDTPTSTRTPEPTVMHTPRPTHTPTLTPTVTLTPTPTIFLTPTETPINFALADSGYDIADVRYSFPREDILVVDFKYRLDENLESQRAHILIDVPRRCQDGYFTMWHPVEEMIGEAQVTFKTTIEGICSAEGLAFTIHPETETYPADIVYEEYVLQPFRIARNFPTLNSDKLSVRNFNFIPEGDWKGFFSFEYRISEDIPIPPEEHAFAIRGSGRDGQCYFYASGPLITEHSGVYEIPVDLPSQIFTGETCLDTNTQYTYGTLDFFMEDLLAGVSVFRQPLTTSITIWKFR